MNKKKCVWFVVFVALAGSQHFLHCPPKPRATTVTIRPGGVDSGDAVVRPAEDIWADHKRVRNEQEVERLRRRFFSTYRFTYVKPTGAITRIFGCCWWRRTEKCPETVVSFLRRRLSEERRLIQSTAPLAQFIVTRAGGEDIWLKRCLFGRDVLFKTTDQLRAMLTKSLFAYMSGILIISRDDLPTGRDDENELEQRKRSFYRFLCDADGFNQPSWRVLVVDDSRILADDLVVQHLNTVFTGRLRVLSCNDLEHREDLYRVFKLACGALIVTDEDIDVLSTQQLPSAQHPDPVKYWRERR